MTPSYIFVNIYAEWENYVFPNLYNPSLIISFSHAPPCTFLILIPTFHTSNLNLPLASTEQLPSHVVYTWYT